MLKLLGQAQSRVKIVGYVALATGAVVVLDHYERKVQEGMEQARSHPPPSSWPYTAPPLEVGFVPDASELNLYNRVQSNDVVAQVRPRAPLSTRALLSADASHRETGNMAPAPALPPPYAT